MIKSPLGWRACCAWTSCVALVLLLLCGAQMVDSKRRENRCMKHYFVHTIEHPTKNCEKKHILLARCKGFCSKSKTEPRVTFSPVLYRPFNYHCKCCRDSLSIMKAVSLNCEGDKPVFATYRYILKCKCRNCNFRRW
ncbi:norrin-like [Crassostrea angulata]|uniref:CTCK domain-containing protein n=2 Tax=Magallana gigas TaxID=29159 RepID=A0A8W8IJ03_MAGGI|nr:norrin [Crassostrea gigas]XP_052705247.1 norrin-like [Crassostrea angulata]|eukprot:XP_011448611.1 PREDICTED: norrin [Crassostrea gigas]